MRLLVLVARLAAVGALIGGAVAGVGWVLGTLTAPRTPIDVPDLTIAAAAVQPVGDPVRLSVPTIGVDAAFEPLSIGADGRLDAPRAVDGPEPGEVGTSVVAGHLDTRTGPAVFAHLPELDPGDEIVVTGPRGIAQFVVERVETYAKATLPDEVYAPSTGPSLRLITCGGDFDPTSGHDVDNVVVFATPVA